MIKNVARIKEKLIQEITRNVEQAIAATIEEQVNSEDPMNLVHVQAAFSFATLVERERIIRYLVNTGIIEEDGTVVYAIRNGEHKEQTNG